MEKYIVSIEFRYNDAPKYDGENTRYINKTVTVGIFDTRDEANNAGNKELEKFEAKFKLNPNYNRKERFSNNGGCFGYPKTLITDLGYLQTPFSFFASITKLEYTDTDEAIDEATAATKRYKTHENSIKD